MEFVFRFSFFKFENEKRIRYPFFVRKFENEKRKNGIYTDRYNTTLLKTTFTVCPGDVSTHAQYM